MTENTTIQPTKDPADKAPEAGTGAAAAILAPKASQGEKWFDWLVYTGLNYWANLGISVALTDVFVHGWGKNIYKSSVSELTKGFKSVPYMPDALSDRAANMLAGAFSLNSGGNILAGVVGYFETRKREYVYWLNERLGVDQTAPDGHKMTPDEIYIEKELESQSWLRIIGRRALCLAATTGAGLAVDYGLRQQYPSPKWQDGKQVTHKNGQEVFSDAVVSGADYTFRKIVPGGKSGAALADTEWLKRYIHYASLDSIYTFMTSWITHATNGAKKKKMPKEIGEPTQTPAPEFHPAPQAPSAEEQEPARKTFAQTKTREERPMPKMREDFVSAVNKADTASTVSMGA